MSIQAVLDLAESDLGYTESPAGSNNTKFGKAYGLQGQPWCVMALWYWFNEAGERMAFFGGGKTASCSTLLRWYREQGLVVPVSETQSGDIVIMNFSGTSDTQHCGIVQKVIDRESGWYRTIEGNTSPGLEGSQDNGGCVALKARHKKNVVAVCRPMYTEDKPADYVGHWSEEDVRWAMALKLVRGYEDGNFRPDRNITRAETVHILHNFFKILKNEV